MTERVYHEPRLQDDLNEGQIEIIAKGFMLFRKVCTGTDIDLETARKHAQECVKLIDAFVDAGKENT